MQATKTTLSSSLLLPPRPLNSINSSSSRRKHSLRVFAEGNRKRRSVNKVDEDMIVLRMRIHEMKMTQENCEASADWMEWEKKYISHYDTDVFEAVGFLQTILLNTRPSFVLGAVVLLALSVAVSTTTVALQMLEVAKWILSQIHFC
ncbi:hypothetical protein ACHQM5_008399 [Ranunculus cassubicifolius]